MIRALLISIATTLVCASGAAGDDAQAPAPNPQFKVLAKVRFEQHLNDQVPLGLEFVDAAGNAAALGQYFGERPVVLVLAYFRCPTLCGQVLRGLSTALRGVNLRAGGDFDVVIVSFDPTDTPAMAAAKKAALLDHYGRPDQAVGWHVLTAPGQNARKLADAVGFGYEFDPASNQFAHASGIAILTPDGRLSRYFYGIDFPTRDLRLALVEASNHRIGTPVDQLLLYCFHYDPANGRYGLAIMRLIQAAGAITVFGLVGFIGFSLRKERKRARRVSESAAA